MSLSVNKQIAFSAGESFMAVITISRKLGSMGTYVGRRLAEKLGYDYIDKTHLSQIMKEYGFSKEQVAERWQQRYDILMEKYKALKKELKNEEGGSKEVIYALVEKVDRQEKIINVLCDAIPTDENTRLLRGR